MGVSDLVDRLPLVHCHQAVSCADQMRGFTSVWTTIRLFPLQRRKVCLDLVVLVELALDVVVCRDEVLGCLLVPMSATTVYGVYEREGSRYLYRANGTFCRPAISSPTGLSTL